MAAWQSELGMRYDLLLDPTLAVSQQYLVRGIPTTYLLDSSQRIRQVYYGPVTRRTAGERYTAPGGARLSDGPNDATLKSAGRRSEEACS